MPHTSEHKIPIEEIFQQSPIPDVYRGYISPGPAGILDDPPKKEKKVEKEVKDKGSILDWFISPAGGDEGVPRYAEEEGLSIDEKHPPMWQLADNEFRTQLDPKGVARYSDMYRDPSKYAHLAYYYPKDDMGYLPHGLQHSVDAFYMDTPTEMSDTGFDAYEGFLPGQAFRQGHSYLSTAGMDRPKVPDKWWISNPAIRGLGKGPEDNWHHEAFHDASTKAVKSEFMSVPHRTIYNYLSVAKPLGIRIEEALAQHHDGLYPKSAYATEESKQWLKEAKEEAYYESIDEDNTLQEQKAWSVYLTTLNNLGDLYNQILSAAKQRHESLGYK